MIRSVIWELCENYTDLSDGDIRILDNLAQQIPYISDITDTDIFIDALTSNGIDAIVLAWASPQNRKSLYENSVVGELAYATSEPAVYRTFQTGEKSSNIHGVSQEGIPIAQTVVPILNLQGQIIGVLIMEKDRSEELRQEEQVQFLSQTAEHLSNTLMFLSTTGSRFEDWLGNGIYVLNNCGKITYVNKVAAGMYKSYYGSDPLGRDFPFAIANCSGFDELLYILHDPVEISFMCRSYLFQAHPLFTYGETSGCVISFQDITDLRQKEQELVAQSTIIREIHHRVKNNLQNVAALLRLQMRRSDSDLVRSEFSACINRIISIATVYEVFALQSWDAIDLEDLSKRILDGLIESSALPDQPIRTFVEGRNVLLPSKQAVPLALVINELLLNSLKHGVSRTSEGEIGIYITEKDSKVSLFVTDNGPGLGVGKNQDTSKHLGLQIVDSLIVDQLGGTFCLERNEGITRAVVCFLKQNGEVEA